MNLDAAVVSLPATERQVVTLRKVYGYRPVEIAVRLHMDLGQVNAILARAMRHLADALEKDC